MAKTEKLPTLPPDSSTPPATEPRPISDSVSRNDLKSSDGKSVSISAPLLPVPEGVFVSRRVDVTLERAEAELLRGIQMGLYAENRFLRNGKPVTNISRAVQYLLENAEAV